MSLSPAARAMGSAAAWTVLLLWWAGLLMVSPLRPEDLFTLGGTTINGVDYADILGRILGVLYWPGIAYAACRIAFDLIRAANPGQVRFTALGDLAFGGVQAWLFVWLWTASPLGPVIHVDSVQVFVDRIRAAFDGGLWSLSTVLMACVMFGLLQALFKMSGALWRLITGQLMPFDKRRWDTAAA